MSKAIFVLVFLFFVQCSLQFQDFPPTRNVSDVRFSLPFSFVHNFINQTVAPMVDTMLNFLTFDGPYNVSNFFFDASFRNLSFKNHTIDWDGSGLFPIANDNNTISLGAHLSFDLVGKYNLHGFLFYSASGNFSLSVKDAKIYFYPNFQNQTNALGCYIQIDKYEASYDTLSIHLENAWILNTLISIVKGIAGEFIFRQVAKGVEKKVNNYFDVWMTKGLIAPLNYKSLHYLVKIFFTEHPQVIYRGHTSKAANSSLTTIEPYLEFGISMQIINPATNATASNIGQRSLATRIDSDEGIFIGVSSAIFNGLSWVVFDDSDVLNITISQKDIPANSSLSLDTTTMKLLFPGLVERYGDKKGIYIHVQKVLNYSQINIRQGRLIGMVFLNVSFYVDKNSTAYPNQGLANCTSCEEAFSATIGVFLSFHSYGLGYATVGGEVLNLDVSYLKVNEDLINVVSDNLKKFLNDIFTAALPIINGLLSKGYVCQTCRQLGINNIGIYSQLDSAVIKINL